MWVIRYFLNATLNLWNSIFNSRIWGASLLNVLIPEKKKHLHIPLLYLNGEKSLWLLKFYDMLRHSGTPDKWETGNHTAHTTDKWGGGCYLLLSVLGYTEMFTYDIWRTALWKTNCSLLVYGSENFMKLSFKHRCVVTFTVT